MSRNTESLNCQSRNVVSLDSSYISKLLSDLECLNINVQNLQRRDVNITESTIKHYEEINKYFEKIFHHLNLLCSHYKNDMEVNLADKKKSQMNAKNEDDKKHKDTLPECNKSTEVTKLVKGKAQSMYDMVEETVKTIEKQGSKVKVGRASSMKYIQYWNSILDKQNETEMISKQIHKEKIDKELTGCLIKKRVGQFDRKGRRKSSTFFSFLNILDDNSDKQSQEQLFNAKPNPIFEKDDSLDENAICSNLLCDEVPDFNKSDDTINLIMENQMSGSSQPLLGIEIIKNMDCNYSIQKYHQNESNNSAENTSIRRKSYVDDNHEKLHDLTDRKPTIVQILLKKPGMD